MFHTQNIMWHWQLLYHVAFSNVSCVHSFSQQLHGGFSTASRSTSNSNSWNAKLQWLSRRSWYFARCNEVVLSFFFVFQDRRWCVEERWTEVVFTKGMVRSKEMHLYYQYRMIHTMGDDWDDYALKHSKFPVVLVPESWCVYIYIYFIFPFRSTPGTEACVTTTDKFLVQRWKNQAQTGALNSHGIESWWNRWVV